MNGVDRCERFINDVRNGKKLVPQTVVQACERFARDWHNPKLDFSVDSANDAVEAIEAMPHTKGRWQGQPFVLEDWQCFVVCNLFGWKWAATGMRRFRYGYLQIPRKNGKTQLAVAIGMVFFGPDCEPGAEILLGATTQDQAKGLLFRPSKYIAKNYHEFREAFGIEINASTLVIPDNDSVLKAVIKKPDDGDSPHFALVDEFHLHDTAEMWSVFDTGMGARLQPLLLTTTTAGHTLGGPAHIYRDDMLKLLRGDYEDDTTFALIYELDEGDEWDTVDALRKVNPNIGVSVSEEYLVSQLQQARRSAEKQNAYRTKHLNEWVGAKTAFMNMVAWQRQKLDMSIHDFIGQPCHVAVDLAEQKDASSVAVMFKRDGKYYAFADHWVPEKAFEWNDKYKTFSLGNHINVTEGNAQDYAAIRAHIDWLAENFEIRSLRFDPWQSAMMMQQLLETGLPVYKQTQQFSDFSDPMKTLETAVLDQNFFHAGDPVLTWMMGNVAALKNRDGHMKPVKDNPNSPRCKIDGAVAVIMAMKGWQEVEAGGLDEWLADPVVLA